MKLSLSLFLSLILGSLPLLAQTDEEPIITFHTNIYEEDGISNTFTIQLGSTEEGEYVDIDCGFGKVEAELAQAYVDDSTGIQATPVECNVSKEGIVRIYGDASKIDVVNFSGCSITDIQFGKGLDLDVLNLEHNELTGIDLSSQTNLRALYLYDNAFDKEPLMLPAMPKLYLLDIGQVGNVSEEFTLRNFPKLMTFDAYHCLALTKVDPTGCPNLTRLSLDMTNVSSVDVTKNPQLTVLNVNDTKVTTLDLSQNPLLIELYCNHTSGTLNKAYKMSSIDVTHNPQLFYFFCAGNNFHTLDVSQNPILYTFSANGNQLDSIDVSKNKNLYSVNLRNNNMDFATLPLDPGTWYEYYYNQRNLPVVKSFKVGDTLDLSRRVLRQGTSTNGVLYIVDPEDPTASQALDTAYYHYEDGKITFLQEIDDSVYVAYSNSSFSDNALETTRFMVKSAENYGKTTQVATIASSMPTGKVMNLAVGIAGASTTNPKRFYVDFGDGTTHTFTTTTDTIPDIANATCLREAYGNIYIYIEDGDQITALKTYNLTDVSTVNLSKAGSLRYLAMPGAGLYTIDLQYNRCLEMLDLRNCNLTSLSLKGTSGYFYKSCLHRINVSGNRLTSFTFDDMYATHYIDLSNNQLTELDFSDSDNLIECNVSGNQFTSLAFTYSTVMTKLDVSNNQLSELTLPDDNSLEQLNISGNKFTLANMPSRYAMSEADFIYAPQQQIKIGEKGIGADLTAQYLTIDGNTTHFDWYTVDGRQLTEGTDYTNEAGLMRFVTIPSSKVYCVITNAAYPAFRGANVLRTNETQPISMPTNLMAEFTTTEDGTAALSMAGKEDGVSVFFDWKGNGILTQYDLTTTYTTFTADTYAGANVKVYTTDDTQQLSVLSIDDVPMSTFDASRLGKINALMLVDAGLTELNLPASNYLNELNLTGCQLTDFDFSQYPNLVYANFCGNKLTSIDLTQNQGLQVAYFTSNNISDVKLNNPNLWALDLGYNNFDEITLSGMPYMEQLGLEGNRLTHIDLSGLSHLRVLNLAANRFTFATLPVQKSSWAVYSYAKQKNIDVIAADGNVVDLSEMAAVGDSITTFRWFLGEPTMNEDTGEYEGEELIEGEEYSTTAGITHFTPNATLDDVVGLITNPQFPNLYLMTNPFTISPSTGIATIASQSATAPVRYNLAGQRISTSRHGICVERGKKVLTQ